MAGFKLPVDFVLGVEKQPLEVLEQGVPIFVDKTIDVVNHISSIVTNHKVLMIKIIQISILDITKYVIAIFHK